MIKYKASSGNEYDLYSAKMQAMEGSFHKYSWQPDSKKKKYGEITKDFVKEAQNYEISLQFRGGLAERKKYLNKLRNDFENDVLSKKPGRMYYGDYWIEGYCIESETGVSKIKTTWSQNDIGFYCPYPFWCKEKNFTFKQSEKQVADTIEKEEISDILDSASQNPDYPWDYKRGFKSKYKPAKKRYLRDYSYDFYSDHTIRKIDNDHFAESAFKMIIYGPCTHPFIQIGNHIYEVNTTLYDSEYLVIDSRERTVIKYTRYGATENLFNARSREHYLFQPIPAGKSLVKWNATYPFDLILYQERSEPPWSM